MKSKNKELLKKLESSKIGGGIDKIKAQHKKGKLSARERIEILLDKNSFEEIGGLVTHRSTNFGLDKIKFLQRKGVDIGRVTPEEAIINISKTFSDTSQPQTAQSKLMQVTWLYNLLSLTDKNRNKFLTDMIYLAEKAGRRFGPYAKLY